MRDPARRAAIQKGEPAALDPDVTAAIQDFLGRHGLAGDRIAVRSSATAEDSARASFAGVHPTVLHVEGAAAIGNAIVRCYASLWTPPARAYREKMGYSEEEVACAVVLCRMVTAFGGEEAGCAGVSFSADPRTGRRDLIVIEAAAGLGDKVVGGRSNPQKFVYRRGALDVALVQAPRSDAVLTEGQARELAIATLRIHWAMGEGQNPQDVEWAHDGKRLWILQARPVTRTPRPGPEQVARLPRYWSTANIQDSLPGIPCEFSWAACEASAQDVACVPLAAVGYQVPPGLQLVRRFQGRVYIDVTFIQWMFFDAFGSMPEVSARSLGGHYPLILPTAGNEDKGAGRRRLLRSLRLFRRLWGFERAAAPYFRKTIRAMVSQAKQDRGPAAREELQGRVRRLSDGQNALHIRFGLASTAPELWEQALTPLLIKLFGSRGPILTAALCAGSGNVTSAEHGYRVGELAEVARRDREASHWLQSAEPSTAWRQLPSGSPFRQSIERFLDDFGHRATHETDCVCPRWVEDPGPILEQVRQLLGSNVTGLSRETAVRQRQSAEQEIRHRKPLWWPLIRWLAGGMRRAAAIRELGKSAVVASALPIRGIALEIGRRLVADGHLDYPEEVFDLVYADLAAWMEGYWDGGGARALTNDRGMQRQAWLREEPPDTIADDRTETVAAMAGPKPIPGDTWQGIAASPGRAKGMARILLCPEDGARLLPGEILVAPSTDPAWTPLFLRAAALVTESSGYLSHGAIVAREYGLPAVVNVPGVLKLLKDGELLEVNGDDGTVTIIEGGRNACGKTPASRAARPRPSRAPGPGGAPDTV
jgi:rifampicin phosphotransferase